jgi:hypothetical protein
VHIGRPQRRNPDAGGGEAFQHFPTMDCHRLSSFWCPIGRRVWAQHDAVSGHALPSLVIGRRSGLEAPAPQGLARSRFLTEKPLPLFLDQLADQLLARPQNC